MAYLDDIPKYAFGTTHEIETSAELVAPAACQRYASFHDDSDSGPSGISCTSSGSSSGTGTSISSSSSGGGGGGTRTGTGSGKELWGSNRGQVYPRTISETKFKELVLHAVELGCRHFDCAPLYKTQPLVGDALRQAMQFVPRQKLFITSKLPPNMMRPENILRSVSRSIEELKCNYLDLFLIHAPFSTQHVTDDDFYPTDDEGNVLLDDEEHVLENAWRQLVDLKRKGFTRYIGLSNVNLEQLIRLNNIHHIDVIQNEYHIYNQDRTMFDYCEEIDVHFEAYAAMGNPDKAQRDNRPCVALDPIVQRVARENKLSIAEVNIQWVYQQPLSYVIRCDTPRQLEENLRATKCISLPVNDLIDLDSLDRAVRLYKFDEYKGLFKHREYPFKGSVSRMTRLEEQLRIARANQQHQVTKASTLKQHKSKQHLTIGGQRQKKINYNKTTTPTSNDNNESDLSSSDCSDMSGERVSSQSNLKTSSSQSDSSITTTLARCSTPVSIRDETIRDTSRTSDEPAPRPRRE